MQVSEQGSQGREAVSGEPCSIPFAVFDPGTYSLRTSQLSLFEDSTECCQILPQSGSMRNGRLYERPTLGRPITVNGSTSWPTPRAAIGSHGICWSRAESGQHRSQLEDYLAWMHIREGGQRVSGWKINPTWLDWLMGFPSRWTELPPSETL